MTAPPHPHAAPTAPAQPLAPPHATPSAPAASLNGDALEWRCTAFHDLSPGLLYQLLRLRSEVFVVEQRCLFLDLDGLDAQALHLIGTAPPGPAAQPAALPEVWAAARLLPPGVAYAEASIGRVVTAPSARASGLGHALMGQALAALFAAWGAQPVRIGAQAHLQGFYRRHGFVADGPHYLEDGIAHVSMLRP